MNKKSLILTLLLVGIFSLTLPAYAVTLNSGDRVQVEFMGENETRIITGRNVELTGELNGDVYVFAGSLISKAVVHGDLIVFAGEALITGDVIGSVRGAAGNFTLNAKARNVTVAAGKLAFGETASAQDVFAAAGEASFVGTLRNLNAAGGKIFFNAQSSQNATLTSGETITLGTSASVSGNVLVKSKRKPQGFDSMSVGGSREWKEMKAEQPIPSVFDVILKIFSLLALVYVLWSLPGIKNTILSFQPSVKSILLPILWAVLIPIVMIILFITMIGVPLAFLLGLAAFIGIITTKSLAVIYLASTFSTKYNHNIHLVLVLGSILLVLLGFIPYLGWIISLVICLLGWAIAVHLFKTAVK